MTVLSKVIVAIIYRLFKNRLQRAQNSNLPRARQFGLNFEDEGQMTGDDF